MEDRFAHTHEAHNPRPLYRRALNDPLHGLAQLARGNTNSFAARNAPVSPIGPYLEALEQGLIRDGFLRGRTGSAVLTIWLIFTPAFVEVLAENMSVSAPDPRVVSFVRGQIPVVTHGVSLSLGSSNCPDPQTLRMLNRISELYASPLISEHIALVRAQADPGYDSLHQEVLKAGHLLPVPLSRLQLDAMVDNVQEAKESLRVPLALEPIATLVEWPDPEIPEGRFVTELLERTDTLLVLDIANVWANATNHGRDPLSDILAMPLDRIAYCHIAGGRWTEHMYHGTHADPVIRAVLELAEAVSAEVGPLPLMLERDDNFPPRAEYFAELHALADVA